MSIAALDNPLERERLLRDARTALSDQARALEQLAKRLDHNFGTALQLVMQCSGRIVVTGIGKSGLVARKIAATMACSRTPAVFLHACEAGHGDLGMVTEDDVVVIVSKSGESQDVVTLLPHFDALRIPIIAITADPQSTIARASRAVIDASVEHECCPHDIVPTTSTLVAQAVGEALAMAVMRARNVSAEELTRVHPHAPTRPPIDDTGSSVPVQIHAGER
jgi:arabinose-5-phosphate isomerase